MAVLPVVSVTTNLFVSMVRPPFEAVAPVTVAVLDRVATPVPPSVPAATTVLGC